MRATGIIRRADDLGRVVIPREIRRQLGIRENEPMEIWVDAENKIVSFQKYQMDMITEVDTAQRNIVDDWMYDIAIKGTAEQHDIFMQVNHHFKALRELVGKFEKSIEKE